MRRTLAARYDLCGLIYASAQMHNVVSLAATVAPSDVPILITGPERRRQGEARRDHSGELAPQGRPLRKVNVGALPDQLLEAELFGAEAGAFTGATKMRVGRFEAADGGTLFLDEIGNLSPPGQAKLLRVLQTGEFERLGSSVTRKADVRVVSATNVDLPRAIAERDSSARIFSSGSTSSSCTSRRIADRPDDILPLAEHFLTQLARAGRCGAPAPGRARPATRCCSTNGQGMSASSRIGSTARCSSAQARASSLPEHLGLAVEAAPSRPSAGAGPPGGAVLPGVPVAASASQPAVAAAANPDRAVIEDALLRSGGIVSKAATELGITRQAFYRRMDQSGVILERRLRVPGR